MRGSSPRFLFCIGAQKAGTTWLYDYFASHPEIHVPAVKEMHYFNVLWDPKQVDFGNQRRDALNGMPRLFQTLPSVARFFGFKSVNPGDAKSHAVLRRLVAMHDSTEDNHAAYRRLMVEKAGTARWVADITPDYSVLSRENYRDMLNAFDGSRFLFVMRDPIERTWSNIKMHVAHMRTRGGPDLTPDAVLQQMVGGLHDHIMMRSWYHRIILALGTLPKGRVKHMFYETMFSDSAMAELADFLEVGFTPGQYDTSVRIGDRLNMTKDQRETLRWLCAPIYRGVYDHFGDSLPDAWDLCAMDADQPAFIDPAMIHQRVLKRTAQTNGR